MGMNEPALSGDERKTAKEKRNVRKDLLISSVVLTSTAAFFKVAGDVIGRHFYKLAIARNDKTELEGSLRSAQNIGEIPQVVKDTLENQKAFMEKFTNEHHPEEVYLESNDHLKLHGYRFLVHPDSHRWVIPLHGYMNEGSDMFFFTAKFAQRGFNALVPDLRGAGKSEGDYIGMGWDDRLDVVGWIHKIIAEDPEARIVIFGISMGAATAMMTAGEKLPENVAAIIEDCGYTSVADEFSYELHQLYSLPKFPVLPLADRAIRNKAGFSIYQASSVEQLKKACVPMLFIHGEKDTYVPTEMVYKVYEAAPVDKELMIIKDAPHASSSFVHPERYFSGIFSFVEKHL
ncbi:alpha/beta hydrolase [Sporolactobacillus vineae]|uniref:alpha/beta hydrolase n=1 Tax=Sporolactobacillus vineae TaxID=444463 RepID=UPI00037C66AF|nr:alpha/beta hydrolase [Sporolactobacillus vineae]